MASSLEKVTLLISMFLCTSFAVYYTTGPQLDYPRLGKRNMYTEDTIFPMNGDGPIVMSDSAIPQISNLNRRGFFTQGSSGIPRIGRRNAFDTGKRGFFTRGSSDYPRLGKKDDLWNEKKGIFTQGEAGLPRYGRSSARDFLSDGANLAYQKVKDVKDDGEDEAEQGQVQGQTEAGDFPRLQASSFNFLFNELDADNDGKLSKDEFSKGMQFFKTQSLMC